jgi:multisubunit Na+/H+ antiporter MnhF subunit
MAVVTVWMDAVLALTPAFAVPAIAACRGKIADRLVAVQLAASVAGIMLVLMSFAFDQTSYVDLALALALLTLPGTLVMAIFIERWL